MRAPTRAGCGGRMPGRTWGDYVAVGSFTLLGDARAAESALAGSGIPVRLEGIGFASALPHMTDVVGGVTLFVPTADAERAREILYPPAEDDATHADDAVDEGPRAAAARRAWRGAVLGSVFLFPPLHLLSMWHLATFGRTSGPVTPRARRQAWGALVIDAIAVAVVLGWIVVALRR